MPKPSTSDRNQSVGHYEITKTKSMQHISGLLWGTSWIYRYNPPFTKALQTSLFLTSPIDSIKYLVSYFFYPIKKRVANQLFESALKVQKKKKKEKKYWSFYAASTLRIAWVIKKLAFGCGVADRTKGQEKQRREKDRKAHGLPPDNRHTPPVQCLDTHASLSLSHAKQKTEWNCCQKWISRFEKLLQYWLTREEYWWKKTKKLGFSHGHFMSGNKIWQLNWQFYIFKNSNSGSHLWMISMKLTFSFKILLSKVGLLFNPIPIRRVAASTDYQ